MLPSCVLAAQRQHYLTFLPSLLLASGVGLFKSYADELTPLSPLKTKIHSLKSPLTSNMFKSNTHLFK